MKNNVTKIIYAVMLFLVSFDVKAQVTMNSLDQTANNAQGQYPSMNMSYAMGSLGMTQSAWLDPLQNLGEGQTKPAYSKYYWSPDLVLPLRLREGMLTLVNFPEWEMIEDVYIGDNNKFTGQISGPNTLLLYPQNGFGVDTNIIVFGRSGNKYVFYARSEGFNTERLTNSVIDIEVVGANGNSGGGQNISGMTGSGGRINASNFNGGAKSVDSTFTKRNQKDDWIKSLPLDPTKFRFDIEVYVPNPDDVVIAPERVWRDDIFTYIDFGERALTMVQRPIVTLIVERVETPVGFRSAGPDNRLIIVEGVGDMVLRNGKRLVCLKLRRSDDQGTEFAPKAPQNNWNIPTGTASGVKPQEESVVQGFELIDINKKPEPEPEPEVNVAPISSSITLGQNGSSNSEGLTSAKSEASDASGERLVGEYTVKFGSNGELLIPEYVKKALEKQASNSSVANTNDKGVAFNGYRFGQGFENQNAASISVELGTDADVNNLEDLWQELSRKYNTVLGGYQPFYSVDAPADGQGKELFHLRIGPVESIDTGDQICGQLGRNGVFCSVVRVQ
ncbi:MAG: TrbG/VirB9 family P-type conjugative transfer protein [Alphaproteobacteria bacterium]|nr:TrbG/VirB9 family P-type conjugative transfer protein [Alphaproteobacteria bacterium]